VLQQVLRGRIASPRARRVHLRSTHAIRQAVQWDRDGAARVHRTGAGRGAEHIGPEDTFDADYGRLLERVRRITVNGGVPNQRELEPRHPLARQAPNDPAVSHKPSPNGRKSAFQGVTANDLCSFLVSLSGLELPPPRGCPDRDLKPPFHVSLLHNVQKSNQRPKYTANCARETPGTRGARDCLRGRIPDRPQRLHNVQTFGADPERRIQPDTPRRKSRKTGVGGAPSFCSRQRKCGICANCTRIWARRSDFIMDQ
jgi:hypothetical protein